MKDWIRNLFIASVAILAPIHSTLIVVGILVFLDTVTGVWAALKKGEKITSAKLRDSVSKLIIFQIAVISAFVLEKYLLQDLLPVSKMVAGIIGLVEATSLFENLNVIYGRNIFQSVIDKLGSSNKVNQPQQNSSSQPISSQPIKPE